MMLAVARAARRDQFDDMFPRGAPFGESAARISMCWHGPRLRRRTQVFGTPTAITNDSERQVQTLRQGMPMKGTMLGLVCVTVLMAASAPALAGGPHYHGHHHHGGGGWRASFFFGGVYPTYPAYWAPAYYPPPVYYYPPPVYPVYPAPVAVVPAPAPAPVVAPSVSLSVGGR
jgi:hypothetical protein